MDNGITAYRLHPEKKYFTEMKKRVINTQIERRISNPPLQVCRALSGG